MNFLPIHPLSFTEFLRATGQEPLSQVVRRADWETLAPFHDRLTISLRDYLFVGGMPEAVSVFSHDRDHEETRQVRQDILLARTKALRSDSGAT